MAVLFDFLNRTEGSARVPAHFIESVDGHPINHSKVTTKCVFSITLMLFSADHNRLVVQDGALPHYFMEKPTRFVPFALETSAMKNSQGAEVIGYSLLRYAPPHDQYPEQRTWAHLNVVVVAQAEVLHKELETVDVMKTLEGSVNFPEKDKTLLDNIVNNRQCYPCGIIDLEGASLQPLHLNPPDKKRCSIS